MITNANTKKFICEILREINDLHQGKSKVDILIRDKVATAEVMAKKMTNKLKQYKKYCEENNIKIDGIETFNINPEKNDDYEKDLEKRTNKKYKTGISSI